MTSIFVVDPGVATGWVEWRDHIIDSGELGQRDFLLLAERYIYDCVVVCESFKVMQSTLKKTFQPASLEIIGALRWFCWEADVPFILQPPSDKTFMPDSKLRALGWWLPGEGHARDAARHLGVYLAKHEKNKEVLRAV